MRNTKQNGAIRKDTSKMALRAHKTTKQEGNTPSTPNLQKTNEKNTIRKIVKEKFKKYEAKVSKMISNQL